MGTFDFGLVLSAYLYLFYLFLHTEFAAAIQTPDFLSYYLGQRESSLSAPGTQSKDFLLRHLFYQNLDDSSRSLQIYTVPGNITIFSTTQCGQSPKFAIKSRSMDIQKPTIQIKPNLQSGTDREKFEGTQQWVVDSIMGPNVTDKETLINLAKMTSDAYSIDPSSPDWINVTLGYNTSYGFGWGEDGLRGQIFVDSKNETVIIAYKGTSVDPRDKWSNNDKINDNVLFSCCCATQRPDPYWYGQVCKCRTDVFQCNSTCLSHELLRKDRYYSAAMEVYKNVTLAYPTSSVWVTGHSMGGAMASLVGLTFNIPAVTFESLPQRLPAARLGLPVAPDPRFIGAYHFGHTADPVYMGACNGYFSSCSIAGFAFESQCFTGLRCAYDTVGDLGWRMGINTHRINNVIKDVLEVYDSVADCTLDEECAECNNWYFNTDATPR